MITHPEKAPRKRGFFVPAGRKESNGYALPRAHRSVLLWRCQHNYDIGDDIMTVTPDTCTLCLLPTTYYLLPTTYYLHNTVAGLS